MNFDGNIKISYFLPLHCIWGKYFLKEVLKVFCFILLCFYCVYVLVDFSSQTSSFHHHHIKIKWGEQAFYYLCDFIKNADALLPFALLIATIRTISTHNVNNEWTALLASGISLRALLRPFIFVGLAFAALIYLNTEFLLPRSLKSLKHIEDSHYRQKIKYRNQAATQHLVLEDESLLLFSEFDPLEHTFRDAYWIRSIDDIYHAKYLRSDSQPPLGEFVDHFTRNSKNALEISASYSSHAFTGMHFNKEGLMEELTPPEELSLSMLWSKFPSGNHFLSEKDSQWMTVFYYKLAMPWLCLLAVAAPLPFCTRFGRTLPQFFIYACAIFGLVSLYLILDASLILGKRQVVHPLAAIGIPAASFALFFGYHYYRIVRNKL
jgi:lipopolysaccharide export system permease protein